MTTCWSDPRRAGCRRRGARPGPMPSARSRSVVGQKHAPVPVPPSRLDVVLRQVGGVDAGQVVAERAGLVEQAPWVCTRSTSGRPCSRRAVRTGGRAAACCPRRRRPWAGPPCEPPGSSGSRRRGGRGRSRGGPASRSAQASTDPSLNRRCPGCRLDVAAAVEATLEVARVEQGHPDARLLGRLAHGEAHRVEVAELLAAGPVVHVVELADEGEARQHHLRTRRRRGRARGGCPG